ncbi:helix-turn-helix transcriptional regulator [Nocardia sp. NPDC050710]|uniref:helix-turn-helix domain-containing protein n=1 Tax=Nocardia sp. NPDC050710 TaxID=3157220 RepID=UPI0033E83960
MPGSSAQTPTAGRSALSGRVAGAILAAIRRSTGDSQVRFSERVGVSDKTIQGWETGLKPLVRLPYTRLRGLHRSLTALGEAPSELTRVWETALAVDELLDAFGTVDPDRHPLALTVPDRATSDLISWAITGQLPRQLRETSAVLHIPRRERDQAAAALCEVADRAAPGSAAAAQLRRHAMYLVAGHQGSQDWIAEQVRGTMRRPRSELAQWSPQWPLARSAAVSAAVVGDTEPLTRFIAGGGIDDRNALINLTYWAHWSGEIRDVWISDAAMTHPSTDSWSGEQLLAGLLHGIVHAPYRELSVHTLTALLATRRQLATDPRWRPRISSTVEIALTNEGLSGAARRCLDQVYYLVRSE